jgi:hypothetical protein
MDAALPNALTGAPHNAISQRWFDVRQLFA